MDFPRSESKPSKKNEEENVEIDEKQFQNDDMLFNQIEENDMEDEKDEKTTHLKKKAPFQTILVDKSIFNVGSYVLGVISRIEELGLLVELPNGNFGRVSPVEISEPLTELYTKISNNELPESSMPSLNKLFKLGDYVRCIILSVENKTKLSLRPTYLNSHLNIKSIKKGYVLFGSIKSIEDHGYNLSFGDDLDLVGFLSNQNTPLKFQVGQLISVTVLKMNKESNVVTVSCIPTELDNYKLSSSHVDSLSMILPGDRVACTVVKVIKKGLYVSFLGDISGTVSIDHLNKVVNPKNISEFYGEGKKFRGKIIFLDHASKKIGISFNKDIVTGRVSTFAGLSIGDTIEQSTVITVSNKNLLLSHPVAIDGRKNPKNMLITVPNSEISDKKKYGNEQLRKKFETGDKIRVRIKQFRMFGGFILGCTRKSFFARKHINIKSFIPGDIIQGKVDAVQPYMRILLGDTSKFFGMCLKNYLSDSKASKTNTWKDKSLKVRIISNINGIINVTIRESILNDKLPIISSVESIKVGMVTLGVITKIKETGCYVSFYQGFFGFVPTKYLNEDLVNPSSFYVGQTKRTYIISSNLEEGNDVPKLLCSFIDLSKSGILSYKPGQIVEATLKELTSKKTIIANVGSVLAKIDKYQISDFEVDNKVIEELVKKNPKVQAVVLNNSRDRDYLLISLKNSLVEAAKRGQLPINKDLELGKVVVGSINAVDDKFVFLEFTDDICGRLHRRQMFQFENPSDSLQSQFFVGAPVMGIVESKNNKGYSLSIEPNKLYSATNFHDHTFLINSYFNETGLFYSKKFEAIKSLSIGDIIDAKVVSVSETETILSYSKANSFKFVLPNDLTKEKKELSPNKTVQVRVIDVDIKNSTVEVSNLGYVMKKSKTAPNLESFISKFKKVNLRVLSIKTEYTVVFHKKCGVVGFCPSKQLNHLSNGESPAFQNFQKVQAFYERVVEEGTLKRVLFSPFFESTEINESVVDPSEIKIGDVVSGEITKINESSLSVKIRLVGKRFVRGYISLNEVVDEVKGKTQNLAEIFKIGQVLPKIKVINATYQVQEENKANRLCYFLSIRPSRIVLDAPEIGEPIIDVEGLKVGQKLVGFVRKVDGDISVGVGKNIIGTIPHGVFALDNEVNKNLAKHYFPGIILNVIVEKTGKYPVLIPLEYKDLIQKKPKVGDIVNGTVTEVSQNDLKVLVKVDNFPAAIHFTEMYDDFTDCQYKAGDEVKAIVLYSGDTLLLSTRPSRLDKSIVAKYPPVEAMSPAKARDSLIAGQTLQGYIKAFYKMNGNVKVAVNGALFGFFIDNGNKKEFYKTGKAILVKVKKINESQLVLDKVEIINYVENGPSPNKNKRNNNNNENTIENNNTKKVPISESTVILQTGEEIDVEVLHVQKFGLILRLKEDPRIAGVCYANNIEGNVGTEFHKNYKAGDSLKVKILYVNYDQNQLKFSIGDISGNKPVQKKKEFFNWEDVQEDHKYKALVEKIIPDMGLVLKLKKNFYITGLCHFNEIVDDSNVKNAKSMLNNFQIGDYVKVYVLSVDPEKKKMKLSIKPSYFTKDDEEPFESEEMNDEDTKKKRKFEEKSEQKEKKSEESKRAKILVQPKVEQEDMESEDFSDSEDEDESKPTEGLSAGSFNFFGSGKSDFVYNQDDSQEDNNKKVSEDDDEQNEQFHIDKNLTKKKKKEQKKEKEMEIREIEKSISEGKNKLESAQDFEKLLLSSPNSSLLWIKYMAFQLHLSEIGKAREIAERALKRIDFREENEKKNVWIAYLNLEFKFGGEQSLQSVFQRATCYNESLTMHLELVNIYIRGEQNEKAEELFKKMLKKFKVHSNVWTKYALFLVQNKRGDEVKKVIDRALLVLPKYKHVLTLSKFAIIEFQHGSVDTGRTIFESILNNFPKRTDILDVYINQEKRLKEFDRVRNLYERAINMKNSVRQMKFFFKNYLKFEQKNGDLERVEQVKKKAYDYVNS